LRSEWLHDKRCGAVQVGQVLDEREAEAKSSDTILTWLNECGTE